MSSRPISILMADDDTDDLELIEETMETYVNNLQFYKVSNGKAALEFLKSRTDAKLPQLIILHYNMPELNGSQVLLELCKDTRYDHISKVVLSTFNTQKYVKECKNNGAVEYFIKPNNIDEPNAVVWRFLAYCKS